MENIDPISAVLCIAGLCVGGGVLLFVLQALGTVVGTVAGVFEIFNNLLSAGPLAWCGCLVGLGVCGFFALFAALMASVLSTCGTANPANLCRLFGGG